MLSRLYADAGQFARAETVLAAELPRAANPDLADRIQAEIYGVHIRALDRDGGATSLGSGEALYRATLETPADGSRWPRPIRGSATA